MEQQQNFYQPNYVQNDNINQINQPYQNFYNNNLQDNYQLNNSYSQNQQQFYNSQLNNYSGPVSQNQQKRLLEEQKKNKKKIVIVSVIVVSVVVAIIIIALVIYFVVNSNSVNSTSESHSSVDPDSPPPVTQEIESSANSLGLFYGTCISNDGSVFGYFDISNSNSNNHNLSYGIYKGEKLILNENLFKPVSTFHNNGFNIAISGAGNYIVTGNYIIDNEDNAANEYIVLDIPKSKKYALENYRTEINGYFGGFMKGVCISNDGTRIAIGCIHLKNVHKKHLIDVIYTVNVYSINTNAKITFEDAQDVHDVDWDRTFNWGDIVAIALNENGTVLVYSFRPDRGVIPAEIFLVVMVRNTFGQWDMKSKIKVYIGIKNYWVESKLITTDPDFKKGVFFMSQFDRAGGTLFIYEIQDDYSLKEIQVLNSQNPVDGNRFSFSFDVQMNDYNINALYVASPGKGTTTIPAEGQVEIFVKKNKQFVIDTTTPILPTNPPLTPNANFGQSVTVSRSSRNVLASALYLPSNSLLYRYKPT